MEDGVGRGDRDDEVQEVGFASSLHPALPVEVLRYDELMARMGRAHFSVAQRPTFGLLFMVQTGTARHTVDFDEIRLVVGRLVFVRPGQVQQWHSPPGGLEASVVLARPELCRVGPWFPGESSYRDLGSESMRTAVDLAAALVREQARFTADETSVRLMGDLFSALVGLFERATPSGKNRSLPEPYVAFRTAIEADLVRSRDARAFMTDLGFSERTITRACRRATGLSAKGVLDQRIMLEAKRLLAHSDLPVQTVGMRLGFGEASNFNKFFVRMSGKLPSAFRAELRASGYGAEDHADLI